ncbi:heavy metal translocating P-type ATPase [Halovivax limisalsi]|uniref:heavy metal translocating P-type ATPase n=1 Tax=Halovivax limisalsi TaxID=1453760 RepID=UPI0024957C1A|nr:heavy metal translocating P-type ATPase [Halovivax limisalsi]
MEGDTPDPSCAYCGRPIESGTGETAGAGDREGDRFCSPGCSRLDERLPADCGRSPKSAPSDSIGGTETPTDGSTDGDGGAPTGSEPASSRELTYLRVDGMHSPHCEDYLEAVATSHDAVVDASASYVTETVRVECDPERIDADALADRLTRLGYTAYQRGEDGEATGGRAGRPSQANRIPAGSDPARTPAGAGHSRAADSSTGGPSDGAVETGPSNRDTDTGRVAPADATGRSYRDRERSGLRGRRHEDMLEVRYVVGVVFGSFLLLPYLTLFYPTYLADFVTWGPISLFADAAPELNTNGLAFFLALTGAVVVLTGAPLLRGAVVAIRLRKPNAHLLATLPILAAIGYSTIAIFDGRYDLYFDFPILVAALVMGAIYWEAGVKRDAFAHLSDLTRSSVSHARRYGDDGSTAVVSTDALDPGDRILVRRGERIPVDGTLAEGECTVEEAVVTGESLPRVKRAGDAVIGGSAVTSGAAVVDVGESTTSRFERLTRTVWDLQSARHGAAVAADSLAARLLPAVVAVAALAGAAALVLGGDATTALRWLSLAVVVATPWALAFATPISVASTIREAADAGIVVFDETVFERLRAVDTVVFDKTGTLTTGEMVVHDAEGPTDALEAAAALERRAAHPAGAAIVDAFGRGGAGEDPEAGDADSRGASDGRSRTDGGRVAADDAPRVEDFETHPTGVGGVVDGESVLVGHPRLFASQGWSVPESIEASVETAREAGRLPVVVGRDGRAAGLVVVGDREREGWTETVDALGDREVIVLTGDDESGTAFLAAHDGVARVFAGVSPAAKTETIRRLGREGRVAMVGDGTNDAPALAAADLGVSLGGGTALAADAADLALARDDLAGVERAFALAERDRTRRRGNLVLAAGYNAIAIPAALVGAMNPLVAALAVGATASAIVGYSWFRSR